MTGLSRSSRLARSRLASACADPATTTSGSTSATREKTTASFDMRPIIVSRMTVQTRTQGRRVFRGAGTLLFLTGVTTALGAQAPSLQSRADAIAKELHPAAIEVRRDLHR